MLELSLQQILDKTRQLPEEFERHFAEEKWIRAAMDYENALLISRFIGLSDAERLELLAGFDADKVKHAFRQAGRYKEDTDVKRETDREKAV